MRERLGEPDEVDARFVYELVLPDSEVLPSLSFALVVHEGREAWPRATLRVKNGGDYGLPFPGPTNLSEERVAELTASVGPEFIDAWCAATPRERDASWESVRDWVNAARPALADYNRLKDGADSVEQTWVYRLPFYPPGSSTSDACVSSSSTAC